MSMSYGDWAIAQAEQEYEEGCALGDQIDDWCERTLDSCDLDERICKSAPSINTAMGEVDPIQLDRWMLELINAAAIEDIEKFQLISACLRGELHEQLSKLFLQLYDRIQDDLERESLMDFQERD